MSKVFGKMLGLAVMIFVALSCMSGKFEDDDNKTKIKPSNNKPNTTTNNSNEANHSNEFKNSGNNNAGNSPANNSSAPLKAQSYRENLPAGFQMPSDPVGQRIMSEYGAVYVARGGVTPPPTYMFTDESQCAGWQSKLKTASGSIGGMNLELQEAAMKEMQAAISEAQQSGVSISPRDTDSARRSYSDTISLWTSRVNPALTYWVGKGRLKQDEANRIKALSPSQQVPEVLRLEDQGIYFSKDFSKSILYSVSAPGASQHLSMLAFDVKENENSKVREILARHNWYQTVVSDLPHFTYLGVPESELPKLGLKKTSDGGRTFWIPAL